MKLPALIVTLAALAPAADLTGNWLAARPNGDGTQRKIYLNLKYRDGKVTGTIRATQFFYQIADSSGGPEHFTLSAVMRDEGNERRATYEITLQGDELSVAQVRNNAPQT